MANPQLTLTALPPALTTLQVKRHLNNAHYDELERIVLKFLTYDGQQIYDAMVASEDAETALKMAAKYTSEFIAYLNKLQKLAGMANDRLCLAAALATQNNGESNDKH